MLNNSRALHNESIDSCEASSVLGSSLEFPLDYAPGLKELIIAYPTHVCVSNLSIDSKKAALDLVTQLYKSGLLIVMK
ncbi:hypothetical protein Mapa_017056 [Marchantia paleacea]|nr:hypothetical protein Mapa_017056 [Marchantia paleacea]